MTTNVLVIGTGISGLTFAIKLASISPKTNIVLICKKDLMEGNTKYAQGGIAVVSNFKNDFSQDIITVSYTHLTLPTKRIV